MGNSSSTDSNSTEENNNCHLVAMTSIKPNDEGPPGPTIRRMVTIEEHDAVLLNAKKQSRDFNSYATNKTMAQGLLDFALLATNVSQMKYILHVGERHPHYLLLVIVISFSFFLQIIVGLLLILLGNRSTLKSRTSRINQLVTLLIFIITTLNIVISGFNMEVTDPDYGACKKFFKNLVTNDTL